MATLLQLFLIISTNTYRYLTLTFPLMWPWVRPWHWPLSSDLPWCTTALVAAKATRMVVTVDNGIVHMTSFVFGLVARQQVSIMYCTVTMATTLLVVMEIWALKSPMTTTVVQVILIHVCFHGNHCCSNYLQYPLATIVSAVSHSNHCCNNYLQYPLATIVSAVSHSNHCYNNYLQFLIFTIYP